MKKIIFSIAMASVILLGGCQTAFDGTFNPTTTVRFVTTTSYPEFPDIQPVAPVNLIAWQHDFPRNMEKVVIKNVSTCIKVPEEKKNAAFWNRCGENPIMTNSNLFVGFDQENWNIILGNFAKLRENIFQHQERINAINRQRQEWRRKAEEERKRIKDLEDQKEQVEESESALD